MKTKKIIISAAILMMAVLFQNCKKTEVENPTTDSGILPSKFRVEIPNSLSQAASTKKSASLLKSTQADTIKGDGIYQNLNTFIFIGDAAGHLVENIIGAITLYHINKPMVLSYESGDDHRTKNLVVIENAEYNSKSYKYELTITDALSESQADGGKAMQIFWNTSPINGIAILKPYNIDRIKNPDAINEVFRIEYSEIPTDTYDSHMVVEIAGIPLPEAQPFAISSLKMYVGKKANRVDVYGNSVHPNATLFTQSKGFDWAFVASSFTDKNIAVAEVGLPPYTLDNDTRKVLLEDYSIKSVLTEQINKWFLATYGMQPDSTQLSKYLKDADAPGFFTHQGFVQSGTAPNSNYEPLASQIKLLTPFNPKSVNELSLSFK